MLVLNPVARITAPAALAHAYFSSDPLPCPPELLPKPPADAHEYQVRKQRAHDRLHHNHFHDDDLKGCGDRNGYGNGECITQQVPATWKKRPLDPCAMRDAHHLEPPRTREAGRYHLPY